MRKRGSQMQKSSKDDQNLPGTTFDSTVCQNNEQFQFSVSMRLCSIKCQIVLHANWIIIIFFLFGGPPRDPMYFNDFQYSNLGLSSLLYYCPSELFCFFLPQNNPNTLMHPQAQIVPSKAQSASKPPISKRRVKRGKHEKAGTREKVQTCESLELIDDSPKTNRQRKQSLSWTRPPKNKTREVRLEYRVEWKNENRNIVPNILNQILSYLLKPNKSSPLLHRLFARMPHPPECTAGRFYQYARKLRESITHFVNESILLRFLEIHQPNCELFSLEEQEFYMKACRTMALSFLRNEVRVIALTSKRMSQAKRKIHLIAREALISKFLEICREGPL